jgi:dCTP deaminase
MPNKDATSPSLFSGNSSPDHRKQGILPFQEIRELIDNGKIRSAVQICEEQLQPASIDLRLGRVAYRVEASFLPSRSSTITARIRALRVDEIDLCKPALLSRGHVFIIPLIESLSLPSDVSGKANPKSTTGRLDIFTRLMTEGGGEFEEVPTGYRGELYVEVVPRTFPIIVRAGARLNQLRFWRGSPQRDDEYLRNLDRRQNLVYYEARNSSTHPDIGPANSVVRAPARIENGLRLTVDLQGRERHSIIAYKAKKKAQAIDLSAIGAYDPAEYWEQITAPKVERFVLQPGDFYLLASKERIGVPPDHAAELEQYDPSLGEFSVHYAGFFDPGFGYGAGGEIKGTRAVLEVRAHEVPILLEDEQTVGRLNYYKMSNLPEKVYGQAIGSSYQQQGLALSKQFKPVESARSAVPKS